MLNAKTNDSLVNFGVDSIWGLDQPNSLLRFILNLVADSASI